MLNTDHEEVLLVGDLNTDFSRDTRFVNIVKDFCQRQNIQTVWSLFEIDYTYSSPCQTSFSTVDHFLYSGGLQQCFSSAGVIHRGDNISCHAPIFLEILVNCLPKKQEEIHLKPPKQNWKVATEEDIGSYRADF